jgi:hypothetical protein
LIDIFIVHLSALHGQLATQGETGLADAADAPANSENLKRPLLVHVILWFHILAMGGEYAIVIRKPLRQQASILAGARPLEITQRIESPETKEDSGPPEIAIGLRRRIEGTSANAAGAEDEEAPSSEKDEVAPPAEPPKPSPASKS